MRTLPKNLIGLIFLVGILLQGTQLLANEEPAAEKPAGHEGSGHGAEGGKEAEGGKKSERPGWTEVEAKISSLEARLHAKETNLTHLIEEKNKMKPNDPGLKDVINEIVKEDRERHQAAEELEKQRTVLRYRFPERGAKGDRKYQKVDLKSVQEIENSMGIEGHLGRAVKKMRNQYGGEEKKKTGPVVTPTPATSDSLENEGSILIQK